MDPGERDPTLLSHWAVPQGVGESATLCWWLLHRALPCSLRFCYRPWVGLDPYVLEPQEATSEKCLGFFFFFCLQIPFS